MSKQRKTNYELRAYILNNRTDLLKDISNAQYNEYKEYQLIENGVILNDRFRNYSDISINDILEREKYSIDCFESFKILHSSKVRKIRLKDRINDIFLDSVNSCLTCYFITFTFSDALVSRTNEETRRRYIQRTLKKFCKHYVANIDFGESEKGTHREHYHAFASCNSINDLIQFYYSITSSFCYVEKLRVYKNMNKSMRKLSMYISKLTNHAVKESVKRNVYIYDRNNNYALNVS